MNYGESKIKYFEKHSSKQFITSNLFGLVMVYKYQKPPIGVTDPVVGFSSETVISQNNWRNVSETPLNGLSPMKVELESITGLLGSPWRAETNLWTKWRDK